ncbi:MAG: hypothetical protein CMI63_15390 [Parvularcula sp.]|mgnify:FL=1|nr:hypothetical protein [Parvularcula sp.]
MKLRKVICVGLPKTGTSSLQSALKILGYKRLAGFDMADCMKYLRGDLEPLVEKMGAHDGAQDWPWPLLYQPLYRAYPDALFVLTVRKSEDVWLDSMQKHAELKRKLVRPPGMRQHIYGYENPADNPQHHIDHYRTHNARVRDYFSDKGELIEACWENGDGWDLLCRALKMRAPAEAFPHANKRKD